MTKYKVEFVAYLENVTNHSSGISTYTKAYDTRREHDVVLPEDAKFTEMPVDFAVGDVVRRTTDHRPYTVVSGPHTTTPFFGLAGKVQAYLIRNEEGEHVLQREDLLEPVDD